MKLQNKAETQKEPLFATYHKFDQRGLVIVQFQSELETLKESELYELTNEKAIYLKLFPSSEALEMLEKDHF